MKTRSVCGSAVVLALMHQSYSLWSLTCCSEGFPFPRKDPVELSFPWTPKQSDTVINTAQWSVTSEAKRPSFKTFSNQYLFNMSACLPSIYDFICIVFYWIVYEKTVQWWEERDRQWCGSWTDFSLSLIPLSMRSVPGQHTRLRVVVCACVGSDPGYGSCTVKLTFPS